MKPIETPGNEQINEYQQGSNALNKPMEHWVTEAKQHLAELRSMRQKIEHINENK
jgi:hypothetical protein